MIRFLSLLNPKKNIAIPKIDQIENSVKDREHKKSFQWSSWNPKV